MCLAVPGKLLEVREHEDPALREGKVEFGGIRQDVSLAFTPQAQPGDYVLVHVGFALSVVDAGEAARLYEDLDRLAGADEGCG